MRKAWYDSSREWRQVDAREGGARSHFSRSWRLFIIQSARFKRSAASRDSQMIYTTPWALFKLICSWATTGPASPMSTLASTWRHSRDDSYQAFRVFHRPSVSVYYCQRKPKNRKNGVGLGTRLHQCITQWDLKGGGMHTILLHVA